MIHQSSQQKKNKHNDWREELCPSWISSLSGELTVKWEKYKKDNEIFTNKTT